MTKISDLTMLDLVLEEKGDASIDDVTEEAEVLQVFWTHAGAIIHVKHPRLGESYEFYDPRQQCVVGLPDYGTACAVLFGEK